MPNRLKLFFQLLTVNTLSIENSNVLGDFELISDHHNNVLQEKLKQICLLTKKMKKKKFKEIFTQCSESMKEKININ